MSDPHPPWHDEPKTKLVCTIGPASRSPTVLQSLLETGVDVIRLNFSHGTQEEHLQVITLVRQLAAQLSVSVAILQDLAGPKVRIGTFAGGGIELKPGDAFTLTTRPVEGDQQRVSVSYPDLPREVKVGDTLLLADGAVVLEAVSVEAEDIHCRVAAGGPLSARKGVNCPSGLFNLPILGEKDLQDLRFGVAQEVDYIGLSFVRTAEDVRRAKSELAQLGGTIPVIAKIETQAALERFDEILAAADGIMVARGDLGIETPLVRVPLVQKEIIAKANLHAKPVITATQMLWSMVNNPRPTRAEVADVANAVLDGTDALMLSEETAVGRYPVHAAQMLVSIATATERASVSAPARAAVMQQAITSEAEAVADAACQIAARIGAEAVVTVTVEGTTARLVAKYRPAQPIVAATTRPDTYRRLAVLRGVTPLLLPAELTTREAMIEGIKGIMRQYGLRGKKVVIVSSISTVENVLTTDEL